MKYIALQLYSIREQMENDFENGLRMAAKAGFNSVEFAGYGEIAAPEMVKLCRRHGLKPISSHVGIDLLMDDLDGCIKYLTDIGAIMAFCPHSAPKTLDEVKGVAEVLETSAAKMKAAGLKFGYHNHAHEFKKIDGKYIMDWLLELAPGCDFQPDVFWVARGGEDPLAYPISKKGRVAAIHAKDIAADFKTDAYTGEGVIDFAALAKVFDSDLYPYIVEQEVFFGDVQEGLNRCYAGLVKKLNG